MNRYSKYVWFEGLFCLDESFCPLWCEKGQKKTSRQIAFSNMLESLFLFCQSENKNPLKKNLCKGFSLQTVKLHMGSELFEES